ncbi:pyridoxal phosphate-dependent transferase [Lophiotrema nucula]|uniref:Pyridoxal phosphate-dependent transferase n=1 Tax=Lophiotrema nucula TaxID=690887 RepID=A0A6A5YM06_9PLEO|nr:pyridoxal phosphate-dependent transferase [Lophiotrema nucula]
MLKLFAYPAQSNMNGRRLPLTWSRMLRSNPHRQQAYSLLDIAALVSTSAFSLEDEESAPDFTVFSFYKIFGFPDLGALIVRKPAGKVFEKRPYFGGGTTEMVTCLETPWFARKEKSLSSRLEDGSLPIRSILALNLAIDAHEKLYGGIRQISLHTSWLAENLYNRLMGLKHWNGFPLSLIYKDIASTYGNSKTQGATVVFNLRRSDGTWIGSSSVGKYATERGLYIRTGSLCNPAGMARALGLTDNDVQRAFMSGFRCGQEYDIRNGIPMGMVRVSLGAMSTLGDIDVFINFVQECFVERRPDRTLTAVTRQERSTGSQALPSSGAGSRNGYDAQESWTTIASTEKIANRRLRDQARAVARRAFCMMA